MYFERGLNKLTNEVEMDATYLNAKSDKKQYWEYYQKLQKLDGAILKCENYVVDEVDEQN